MTVSLALATAPPHPDKTMATANHHFTLAVVARRYFFSARSVCVMPRL